MKEETVSAVSLMRALNIHIDRFTQLLSRSGRKGWFALFFLVCLFRFLLPGEMTDTALVHTRIVDSLMSGHNWGRQALVGSYAYPLLPTLALLLAEIPARLFGVDPVRLLTAVCQAWTLCYLFRFSSSSGRIFRGMGILLAAFLFPEFREALLLLDPSWITVLVSASMIYHADRWFRESLLRDAVVVAVLGGFLAFAGVVPCLFAASVLYLLCCRRRSGGTPGPEGGITAGTRLLIWAPFVYGLILWYLWNWLILGDLLFSVRELWHWFSSCSMGEVLDRIAVQLRDMPRSVPAAAVALVLAIAVTADRLCVFFLGLLGGCVCGGMILRGCGVFPAGATLLSIELAVLSIIGLLHCPWHSCRGWHGIRPEYGAILIWCLFAVLSWLSPGSGLAAEARFSGGAPQADDITRYIDQFWPDSRVMVYGIRVPAIYHDPREHRFVASLDYHEGLFLSKAQEEQLHLLVPPPWSGYYSAVGNPFAAIHRHGGQWLLLEKQYPGGWQLWRCVIPPVGESKLPGVSEQ